MNDAAVLTFINNPSGRYRWWDTFPAMIGESLAQSGVDHVCFRRGYEERSTEPPQTRHPTPEGSLGDLRWLRENVRPIATRYRKVIFHTHGHYRPVRLWREVWHHGRARWFWTEHRIAEPGRLDPIKKKARSIGQRFRLYPDRLFGVSETGTARLREQYPPASVRCIRTSVQLTTGRARFRTNVPRHALFIGRLIEEKGIWPLLEAFALLRRRCVDVSLTIVGPGPTDEIETFLRAHDLTGMIRLAGYQSDVERFYREADFVIIPSVCLEALGMVSLEARMYGLPVVYSMRGGLPETQIESVTGLGLRNISAEEIAERVVELQSDPLRYAEMSRRAPVGLEEFSIERMVDAYVGEYLTQLDEL